jgi:hypothetical protein
VLWILFGEPWHERVVLRLINLHLKIVHYLLISLHFSLPQSVLEELARLPLLLALLLKHILQQVRISFHETLSILETMLKLFFAVSLYPLKKCGQSHLLSFSEVALLLEELVMK